MAARRIFILSIPSTIYTAKFRIVVSGCVLLLSACSSISQNPIIPTFAQLVPNSKSVDSAKLDSRFHYLRVTVNGKVVLLASGTVNIDAPDAMSVWYSADREVLRFQNGRLVAAVGLISEWRNVRVPVLPEWNELVQNSTPLSWTRFRDVMPGYRYDLADDLILQRIPAPNDSELKALEPSSLVWFEERMVHTTDRDVLPAARYAVAISKTNERVVYGEQCISKNFCFSWQQWPVVAKDKQ